MKNQKILSLKNISKSFGDKLIINDFSFDFGCNNSVCFFGESGCGKTTLFNIITGLVKADMGEVITEKSKFSVVFQENRLIESLSAKQNLVIVLSNSMPIEKAEKISEEYLNLMGLSNEIENKVSSFSGGMKRRVAIARSLCFNGDIFVLDEPFKGLDPDMKKDIMNLFLKKKNEALLIFITHDIDEAFYLADKIVFLKKGLPLSVDSQIDIKNLNDYEITNIKNKYSI